MVEQGVLDQVTREKLTGHKGSVNSLELMPDREDMLLSCGDDGSTRLWDLRINRAVTLLKGSTMDEVVQARSLGDLVVNAQGDKLNFFDLRNASLVVKDIQLKGDPGVELHDEEINSISMAALPDGFRVASSDDNGHTIVQDIKKESLERSSVQRLLNKHTQSVFLTQFSKLPSGSNFLYTSGFDYKLVSWNLAELKQSKSTSIQQMLTNHLGDAMSYNPPYPYCMDTFLSHNGSSEQIVLGLGNGMIVRYKKKGLGVEEVCDGLHGTQVSAIKADTTSSLLFSASCDMTFGIHKMNLNSKDLAAVEETTLKVAIEAKPSDLVVRNFSETKCLYLSDIEGGISRFNIKY